MKGTNKKVYCHQEAKPSQLSESYENCQEFRQEHRHSLLADENIVKQQLPQDWLHFQDHRFYGVLSQVNFSVYSFIR
jgi:hypothetical protein